MRPRGHRRVRSAKGPSGPIAGRNTIAVHVSIGTCEGIAGRNLLTAGDAFDGPHIGFANERAAGWRFLRARLPNGWRPRRARRARVVPVRSLVGDQLADHDLAFTDHPTCLSRRGVRFVLVVRACECGEFAYPFGSAHAVFLARLARGCTAHRRRASRKYRSRPTRPGATVRVAHGTTGPRSRRDSRRAHRA